MGRRAGRVIDFKQWFSTPSLVAEVTTNGNTLGGAINFLEPATILRVRGAIHTQFDESVQVGDRMRITAALGIISTDSFNSGSANVPDPAGEPEYPWLWWDSWVHEATLTSGVPGSTWGPGAPRAVVDTKAMRRMKPSQSLVTIVETSEAIGAPTVQIHIGQMRTLIGT